MCIVYDEVLSDSRISAICTDVCNYFGIGRSGFIEFCNRAINIYGIPENISTRAIIMLIYNGTMFIKYADKLDFYFRLDENIDIANLQTCKLHFSMTNGNAPVDMLAELRFKPFDISNEHLTTQPAKISFNFGNSKKATHCAKEIKQEVAIYKEPVDMRKNIYYMRDKFVKIEHFYDEDIYAVRDFANKLDILSRDNIEKYNTKLCLKFFNDKNKDSHYMLISATQKHTIILCVYNTWYAYVKMHGIAHIVDIIMSTFDPCKVANALNSSMKKISIKSDEKTVSGCVSHMMKLLKDDDDNCELLCTYLTDFNNEKIKHLARTYKCF